MTRLKTVLVTGANGFVGRATVDALTGDGWSVTKAVRPALTPSETGSLWFDLAQPESIMALAKEVRFDAIVHLGAKVGWSGECDADLFVPNVLATGCLAHLATIWDAQLLFASAALVHGLRTDRIDQRTPVAPDSPYARSKWLAEEILAASAARHCVFRIGGVFGAHGPGHLGVNLAIAGAAAGTAPTRVGSGNALRNYLYVKDLAAAIAFALGEGLEGTHLVAGSETLSIATMLQQICEVLAPGLHPVVREGWEATDQVIHPSPTLPGGRSFKEALLDIGTELRR